MHFGSSCCTNGLSLCIQGTYLYGQLLIYIVRFIPVYTGNMSIASCLYVMPSVYPCVYREHKEVGHFATHAAGLSLCIQGTSCSGRARIKNRRFIPVYTGNIKMWMISLNRRPVYPCVYREHFNQIFFTIRQFGLSLCIQGTYKAEYSEQRKKRFIPVYTGNISSIYRSQGGKAVYPCVYREHG